jgi:hypothetical protein
MTTGRTREDVRAEREAARDQRKAALVARRAEVAAEKAAAREEGARRAAEAAQMEAAARAAAARHAASAFDSYVALRECMAPQRERDEQSDTLSPIEQQMRAELAYLWNATPADIARLRRCGTAITGVQAERYDAPAPDLLARLKRDYRLLRRQAGTELCVHEPALLGGFGVQWDGGLVNEDSVRWFGGLVAFQDAAVLPSCRGAQRRLVWDIGGGWGGFAQQFKTVCPNVTYLTTARPELLLASATYLQAVFPSARVHVHQGDADATWADWTHTDFVFATEASLPLLHPPAIDVVVDVLATEAMTPLRADRHVRWAAEFGARFVYVMRRVGAETPGAAAAAAALDRHFWPPPVPPRAEHLPPVGDGLQPVPIEGADYQHVVGWRRLRA